MQVPAKNNAHFGMKEQKNSSAAGRANSAFRIIYSSLPRRRILRLVAFEDGDYVAYDPAHVLHRNSRAGGDVGSEDHVFQAQQREIVLGRLGIKNIQRCSRQMFASERLRQRLYIKYLTPAGVDQDRILP